MMVELFAFVKLQANSLVLELPLFYPSQNKEKKKNPQQDLSEGN